MKGPVATSFCAALIFLIATGLQAKPSEPDHSKLTVYASGPVEFYVEDPSGKIVGFDSLKKKKFPDTKTTHYTSDQDEETLDEVSYQQAGPLPDGTYQIVLTSKKGGTFTLFAVAFSKKGEPVANVSDGGTLDPNSRRVFKFKYDSRGKTLAVSAVEKKRRKRAARDAMLPFPKDGKKKHVVNKFGWEMDYFDYFDTVGEQDLSIEVSPHVVFTRSHVEIAIEIDIKSYDHNEVSEILESEKEYLSKIKKPYATIFLGKDKIPFIKSLYVKTDSTADEVEYILIWSSGIFCKGKTFTYAIEQEITEKESKKPLVELRMDPALQEMVESFRCTDSKKK